MVFCDSKHDRLSRSFIPIHGNVITNLYAGGMEDEIFPFMALSKGYPYVYTYIYGLLLSRMYTHVLHNCMLYMCTLCN